ncbi:MAG: cardiolipin synthase [Desulfobacterales bacterium]|nr:cardiolipin synthase [Desulfobacterales bacterium]MDD4073345.1 cardiolipin synthase [Desulfobacterales bacterium]MDD4391839.1 cardiolipin synthase [Desulfobacterales bacterium]
MVDTLQVSATIFLTAHWLIVVGLSLRVIARRLPVGVSLAWLAVVYAVPFAGAGAYLFFGGKRLDRRRITRHAMVQAIVDKAQSQLRHNAAAAPTAACAAQPLYRQSLGLLGIPALNGNSMRLLCEFNEVFDSLASDIAAAQESCRLAFYIWHDGGRADDIVEALLRAQNRGVHCRILVDAVGSKVFLSKDNVRKLRTSGVEVVKALPPSFRRRADLRNHRKIVVIDDRVAYTGSQNLVDPRFFKQDAGVGEWVDAVVRLEGPAVALLTNIFEADWSVETGATFEIPIPRSGSEQTNGSGGDLVQVVPSGPVPYPDAIRQLLLTTIYSAHQTLTLTTPYFVPDEAIQTALLSAAARGVEVSIVIPASNDSFLVRHASAANFEDLLKAGVRIALFQNGLLHTKSMVVDGSVTIFGSVNLDMRSFWLNFEVSLFVYGASFAAAIIELQQSYLVQSTLMDAKTWRQRPVRRRFLENFARLAGPLL